MIPFAQLTAGEWAEVVEIDGDACYVQHLRELGLHPGTAFQLVRHGSPAMVRVHGSVFAVRFCDECSLWVQPTQPVLINN
ncbi:MAG: FeoA family protein [Zavarzinella sp.]